MRYLATVRRATWMPRCASLSAISASVSGAFSLLDQLLDHVLDAQGRREEVAERDHLADWGASRTWTAVARLTVDSWMPSRLATAARVSGLQVAHALR